MGVLGFVPVRFADLGGFAGGGGLYGAALSHTLFDVVAGRRTGFGTRRGGGGTRGRAGLATGVGRRCAAGADGGRFMLSCAKGAAPAALFAAKIFFCGLCTPASLCPIFATPAVGAAGGAARAALRPPILPTFSATAPPRLPLERCVRGMAAGCLILDCRRLPPSAGAAAPPPPPNPNAAPTPPPFILSLVVVLNVDLSVELSVLCMLPPFAPPAAAVRASTMTQLLLALTYSLSRL